MYNYVYMNNFGTYYIIFMSCRDKEVYPILSVECLATAVKKSTIFLESILHVNQDRFKYITDKNEPHS